MSAAAKRVKAAKAPADRESGTHRTSDARTAEFVQDSGEQPVATATPVPATDKLKCLALRALGGCKAIDNEDPVESHLDAIQLDLDMVYLAMTNQNEEVDAFRLNNFIRRLIDRVEVVREIYNAKGDRT